MNKGFWDRMQEDDGFYYQAVGMFIVFMLVVGITIHYLRDDVREQHCGIVAEIGACMPGVCAYRLTNGRIVKVNKVVVKGQEICWWETVE